MNTGTSIIEPLAIQ
ncbi:hypothetical protein OH492_04045 [Vibrio chagasii]|nr:hypothetical protein [Vibrio chagasii]